MRARNTKSIFAKRSRRRCFRKNAPAFVTDRVIYRTATNAVSVTLVLIVILIFILALLDKHIPAEVVSIASTAIGVLVVLFNNNNLD